ncbi:MAG TPA: SRPBCC family protein [Bryobacteraceae bacterium]
MMPKWFQLDRPISRGSYFIAGLLLFVLKHNLDRLIAIAYKRPWGVFSYLAPVQKAAHVSSLTPDEIRFLGALLLTAIPFVAAGVWLTLRRLRTLGLPGWLVVAFFLPILNLLLFAYLSLMPARTPPVSTSGRPAILESFIPESALGSAAVSLLFTVPLGLAFLFLGTAVFAGYGWGLFVAIPFSVGMGAALVFGFHKSRSLGGCIGVAVLANLILGGVMIASAIEGLLCLVMALPIALVLAVLGGLVGYALQHRPRGREHAPAMLALLLFLSPGVMTTEWFFPREAPLLRVVSSIEVNAPPERVWKHVVSFAELPPPEEAIFRAGVAYPIRAHIEGSGPGAIRYCEFSTGPFVEPIKIWDEPRLLQFSVSRNPRPMQEWSPYRHVEPMHLDGYLVSRQGQFRLVALPGGRTLLEGTTWYQHHLWPAGYWQSWSDAIIHRIHLRVLRHVKALSETAS